jgi:UDP-N-acetylglucosamine 2-epimerase (non-hydrolysing)
MVHVFVGTKAQFIKMAPIMQELDRRHIVYNFIDAGQHAGLTGDLIEQFNLREPDVFLREEMTSIDSLHQAIFWTVGHLWRVALKRRQLCRRVFRGKKGVCLIHGDTLTTLLSLLYAKRCGLRVAHVEAGLRSYNLLNPFPEEIIRLIAMRYSDILFAPSDRAFENLREMGYEGKSVNAGGNTILDAVRYAKQHTDAVQRPAEPYVTATVHRVETIYSRARMEAVVTLLEKVGQERKVLFVLHEPTRQQLSRFGLYDRLHHNQSIELLPLQPYLTFVGLLEGADFVVTDGGSVQEETHLLGVPCLIMRSKTERLDGLGENACLAGFERESVEHFLGLWPMARRDGLHNSLHPSGAIVDHVLKQTGR